MKEIVLVSSVVISMLLFYLVYKTMKNETHFKNEITRINRQVNELNSSLLLKEKNNLLQTQEQQQQNSNETSETNLQKEYDNYLESFGNTENTNMGGNIQELSNELKEKIDLLETDNLDNSNSS